MSTILSRSSYRDEPDTFCDLPKKNGCDLVDLRFCCQLFIHFILELYLSLLLQQYPAPDSLNEVIIHQDSSPVGHHREIDRCLPQ